MSLFCLPPAAKLNVLALEFDRRVSFDGKEQAKPAARCTGRLYVSSSAFVCLSCRTHRCQRCQSVDHYLLTGWIPELRKVSVPVPGGVWPISPVPEPGSHSQCYVMRCNAMR